MNPLHQNSWQYNPVFCGIVDAAVESANSLIRSMKGDPVYLGVPLDNIHRKAVIYEAKRRGIDIKSKYLAH